MFFTKKSPPISIDTHTHEYYYDIIHRIFSKYIVSELSILKSNPTLAKVREDNLFPSILYHVSTLYAQIPDLDRYILDTEVFKSYSRLLDTIGRIGTIVPEFYLMYLKTNFIRTASIYSNLEDIDALMSKYPWWYLLPLYQDAYEDTVIYSEVAYTRKERNRS